jgi:heme O synthase-like polyprenyltransferase
LKERDPFYIILSFLGVTLISASSYLESVLFSNAKPSEIENAKETFIYSFIFLFSCFVWGAIQVFTK